MEGITNNVGLENVCVGRNFLVGQGNPSGCSSEIGYLPLTTGRNEFRVQSLEVELYAREYIYLVSLRVAIVLVPPNGAVDPTRVEQVSSLVRVRDVEDFVYTIGDVRDR